MVLSIDPIKYPLTGIGRYTFELARQLDRMPEIESLKFLRGGRLCDSIPLPVDVPNALSGIYGQLLKSKLTVALYRLVMPWMKARALRGLEDHVFHGPNFYLPPFGGRSVVTMHDLSTYTWANCHPPERVDYMRKEIELSLKRASMLIADSEFNRREIIDQFGWSPEKVRAVSLASGEEFHPRKEDELIGYLKNYGLSPGRYSLFVGTIEPRKNITALLDAYAGLPEAVRRNWPLVLVGYKGWSSEAIHTRIQEAERAGWLRYLGFVASSELPYLFSGARLFVYPSLYEGFGLPVLEAMASGVPVVCSNAASLPEVAGDAAAMCEASDVVALRDLIVMGLEDETWRTLARERGLARATQFSWERCARETAMVYQDASLG